MPAPARPPSRLRLALVFGGRSTEHAISCVSAGSVLTALDRNEVDVLCLGITREGRWVLAPDDPAGMRIEGRQLPEVDPSGPAVVLPADPTSGGLLPVGAAGAESATTAVVAHGLGAVDVIFPLLHGPWGEDGTVQGLFEMAGVPYVGSGVLASAAAMDKPTMKVLLQAAGIATPAWVLVDDRRWGSDRDAVLAEVGALGLPVFVKPARGGSSLGVSRVVAAADLEAAVEAAREHDPRVIVEQGADGREIECGVLAGVDGGPPQASTLGEIVVTGHDFYTFEAKYLDGGTGLEVPADLPSDVVAAVQDIAVRAFVALGCEGLARVDFFVAADGTPQVNEVNTMPGFTPTSMFPQLWAAAGVDYPTLVRRLVDDALHRGTGLR